MLQPSRDLRQGGLAGVGGAAEHPLGDRRDEKRDELGWGTGGEEMAGV